MSMVSQGKAGAVHSDCIIMHQCIIMTEALCLGKTHTKKTIKGHIAWAVQGEEGPVCMIMVGHDNNRNPLIF